MKGIKKMPNSQILLEMATLAKKGKDFDFYLVMHTNDHEPAHLHVYLSKENIKTDDYFTRLIIPSMMPTNINDLQTLNGEHDNPLPSKSKQQILKWFLQVDKEENISNYSFAKKLWAIYKNTD